MLVKVESTSGYACNADFRLSIVILPLPPIYPLSSWNISNICIHFFTFLIIIMGQGNVSESEGCDWKSDDLEENDYVKDGEKNGHLDTCGIAEPFVGMEFDSEEEAKTFYTNYAKQVGFVVRNMQSRCSETDGKTLARRLGCNKHGLSPKTKGKDNGPEQKPNQKEGCDAKIMFKLEKSGKWVVSKFVKDHNHPLAQVHGCVHEKVHEKEKKIQELSKELQRQEEIYSAYRENLINILTNVEKQADQLSSKVLAVVQSVRKAESEALVISKS